MSTFSNFVIGANTFLPTADGYYSLSTRGYADPLNQIKIKGGKRSKDGKTVIASVTRVWQKDATAGVPASRVGAELSLIITVNPGITATEIDSLVGELSTVLTPQNLDQILAGGQ